MVRILVAGGKLQGIEALYLAKKAGYITVLADQNPHAPGTGLADEMACVDLKDQDSMLALFRTVDVVIPAIEESDILKMLIKYGKSTCTPVIFDEKAYEISSSKSQSNELFKKLDLPMPATFPDCGFPVIIKPDDLSGSIGVGKAYTKKETDELLRKMKGHAVVQEYLEGPSYSLEVIGDGEHACYPLVTEVIVDENYDCKRIIAPALVAADLDEDFLRIGRTINEVMHIKGIFDIEVIYHDGQLKLLEIDARLPSQTPISVYHATGLNMVKLLVDIYLKKGKDFSEPAQKQQVCYYQQIEVKHGEVALIGEHRMGTCGKLHIEYNFFGAEEAITDYQKGSQEFRAILIINAPDNEAALQKFIKTKEMIINDRI